MPRMEPDAGPNLLLKDYGNKSQRWLAEFAAANDSYKQAPDPSLAPREDESALRLLPENKTSRTARWLKQYEREKAELGPFGGPNSNLTAAEAPEIHLLVEDYQPGPRFVQQFENLVFRTERNGSVATPDPNRPLTDSARGAQQATQHPAAEPARTAVASPVAGGGSLKRTTSTSIWNSIGRTTWRKPGGAKLRLRRLPCTPSGS